MVDVARCAVTRSVASCASVGPGFISDQMKGPALTMTNVRSTMVVAPTTASTLMVDTTALVMKATNFTVMREHAYRPTCVKSETEAVSISASHKV